MKLRGILLATAALFAIGPVASHADDGLRLVSLTLSRITAVTGTGSTAATNLGFGTAATANTGTSGATVPLLNTANTYGAGQTFSGTGDQIIFSGGGAGSMATINTGPGYASPPASGCKINLYGAFDCISPSAAGMDYLTGNGNFHSFYANSTLVGRFAANGLVFPKMSAAPVAAPGAGFANVFAIAGTNSGTCKLQVMAGTSTTPVTIIDNVGTGC